MKKILLALSTALTLAACSGAPSNPTTPTPPPAPKTTLNQGDWIWVAVNLSDTSKTASGIASFSVEVVNKSGAQEGKLVGGGVFVSQDQPNTIAGIAALGPIASPLDVFFSDVSATKPILVGVDEDGKFEPFTGSTTGLNGHPYFFGTGRVYNPDNATQFIDVGVGLVQRTTAPSFKPSAQVNTALQALGPWSNTAVVSAQSVNVKVEAQIAKIADQVAISGHVRAHGDGSLSRLMQGK
jgi:hypothetical protein